MNHIKKLSLVTSLFISSYAVWAGADTVVENSMITGNSTSANQAVQNKSPEQYVQELANSLITRLKEDRKKGAADLEDLNIFFEKKFIPMINMDKITRGVMAKHYAQVSSEQKEKFKEMFKKNLINFYIKGMQNFSDEKVEVYAAKGSENHSLDAEKKVSNNRAKVHVDVIKNNGAKIPILYSLYREPDGAWKVDNVFFSGINFMKVYRDLFAASMAKNKGNFDKVLEEFAFDTLKQGVVASGKTVL